MTTIHAFVLINAEPQRISGLAKEIASLEGVREVHSTAGSGVAVVAILAVASHEKVADIVTEGICPLDGVRDTQTLISFRRFSERDLDAAYDIFE